MKHESKGTFLILNLLMTLLRGALGASMADLRSSSRLGRRDLRTFLFGGLEVRPMIQGQAVKVWGPGLGLCFCVSGRSEFYVGVV